MGWKQRVPGACSNLLRLLRLHRPKVRLLFQQRSEHERTLKKPHTAAIQTGAYCDSQGGITAISTIIRSAPIRRKNLVTSLGSLQPVWRSKFGALKGNGTEVTAALRTGDTALSRGGS